MSERYEAPLTSVERGLELGRLLTLATQRLYEYGPDDSVPVELRDELENGLDSLWLEEHVECLFSGWANVTGAGAGVVEKTDYVEAGLGFSDGFWVTRFGRLPKGSWQVGLGFNRFSDEADDVHYVLNLQHEHGIVPVMELEAALPEIPTVHQILSQRSDSFVQILSDPGFLNLNRDKQRHVALRAIRKAHSKCAEFAYDISNTPMVIDADAGYALVFNGKTAEYRRFELHALTLTGICRGIDSLITNRLNRGEAITDAEQLVNPNAGLCLMYEPDEESLQSVNDFNDIKLAPDTSIAIPISNQNIEVIFASDIAGAVQNTDY